MAISGNILLIAVVASCLSMLLAFPMDGFAFGHKCRCVRTTSSFIHPRQYKKIEILPVGANCRRTEILILKKNNNTVCVNPDAKWVKKVINRFVNRSENTQGTARTVTLSGWP